MKSADNSDYCTKSGSRTTPLSSMMLALTESTGDDAETFLGFIAPIFLGLSQKIVLDTRSS